MADSKISDLTDVVTPATTDAFPVVQGGVTKKETIAQVATALGFSASKLAVSAGGTGAGTLTSHGVLVGAGTSAVAVTSAGTSGQVLTSNGASADPTFQALPASGIGGSTGATDNALLRADGTGGATAQASSARVDDTGNLALYGADYLVIGDPSLTGGSAGFKIKRRSAGPFAEFLFGDDSARTSIWADGIWSYGTAGSFLQEAGLDYSGVRVASTAAISFSGSAHDAQQAAIATIKAGTGSPEGVVSAPVGSLFLRSDGGAGTTLYVKESGTGNTGWVAK